jgi:hypothetical protein
MPRGLTSRPITAMTIVGQKMYSQKPMYAVAMAAKTSCRAKILTTRMTASYNPRAAGLAPPSDREPVCRLPTLRAPLEAFRAA